MLNFFFSGLNFVKQPTAQTSRQHWSAPEAPDPGSGGEQAGLRSQRDWPAPGAPEVDPPVQQSVATAQSNRVSRK